MVKSTLVLAMVWIWIASTNAQATTAPVRDALISKNGSSSSATIQTGSFSTTSGNELLLAFISSGTLGTQVSSVSGGSLTWERVILSNAQAGNAEIWRAFATTALSNITVSATLSQSAYAAITVVSFKGVDASGSNGVNAIGATLAAGKATGAPSASIVTTRDNSWVIGVGDDPKTATARTLGKGQTMINQFLTPAGTTLWVQSRNKATALSGTTVKISDTAPTSDPWNLALVEIRPPAGSVSANFTIDAGTKFQTIDGMGVNINVNSWSNGQLKPALDYLVDTNGASVFRVIRDPMTWVSSESLIPALHNLDPVTLQQVYETPAMQDIWNTIGYLNSKGIVGKQIVLNFMGWTPTWLGGSGAYGVASYITAGKEGEFATMVGSLVYYGRRVKGLNFTYLSPTNEEDWNCLEGPCISSTQYKTVMQAVVSELSNMGLTDTRLISPETASSPTSYITSISGVSAVFSLIDHLTFHVYSSTASPGTAYAGKNYWITETAQWCDTCDTGGSITAAQEWTFASQTNDLVLGDLSNGIGAVMVYDGYDSFYYHHNAMGYWGLLAYKSTTGTYVPRKRFYVNSQVNRFIPPGAQRIKVSTSVNGLGTSIATYNSTTQKFTIVGRNTSASAATINAQILNLPISVNSLSIYTTTSSTDLVQGTAVPVTNGTFQITVPADSFFSLSN